MRSVISPACCYSWLPGRHRQGSLPAGHKPEAAPDDLDMALPLKMEPRPPTAVSVGLKWISYLIQHPVQTSARNTGRDTHCVKPSAGRGPGCSGLNVESRAPPQARAGWQGLPYSAVARPSVSQGCCLQRHPAAHTGLALPGARIPEASSLPGGRSVRPPHAPAGPWPHQGPRSILSCLPSKEPIFAASSWDNSG